jgi:hypothetical protein
MNLAPVGVEHAHGDGLRRPIGVHDELDRGGNVSGAGAQFANNVAHTVEELDSVLHHHRSGSRRSSIRFGCIERDSLARHARRDERNSPPVRGRPACCVVPSGRTTSRWRLRASP